MMGVRKTKLLLNSEKKISKIIRGNLEGCYGCNKIVAAA